jgi:threonine/homoserine/homoserine lactone efflux protein
MFPASVMFSGAVLGLSISAPVGPMGLLCINRTLKDGIWAGVSTGAGATTVQVLYCCVLLLTLDQIGPWLESHRAAFSVLGAVLMLFFAWRLVGRRRRIGTHSRVVRRSLFVTYLTAAAFNATNPMLMLLMLGGVSTLLDPMLPGGGHVRFMLGGLFLGSITWWICLSGVTALLSSRMSPSLMGMVDKAIATILLGFSAVAAARALGLAV